jgi:hypothetical protein
MESKKGRAKYLFYKDYLWRNLGTFYGKNFVTEVR